VDRVLRLLGSRAARRGWAGEPVWLAVAVAAWLVRRARVRGSPVVWKGKLGPGEGVVITTLDPRAPDTADAGRA
jgi:hypothetical protein